MRLTHWLLFLCLSSLVFVAVRSDDDDDLDEDITIEDPTSDSSAASGASTLEKGNVPTVKTGSSSVFFEEQFQEKDKWSRWVKSQAKKEGVDEILAKYDGEWAFEVPHSSAYNDDYALILKVGGERKKRDNGLSSKSSFVLV